MTNPESTRREVSADYARAVSGAGGCCAGPIPKDEFVQLIGYSEAELAALPADAVDSAFGCGNPLAFSGVRPGQTVLDLGSGAGIDLLLAAAKVGPAGRVIGVDMTDEMIARAYANIAAAGLANVEVRKGIIEELPVADAAVDWVVSNCVINLSPEKARVFAEIARVLRPGGTMLVSDIVADGLPAGIAAQRHLYSSCLAGAISERAYTDGLRAAGLVDVEVIDRVEYSASEIEMFIGSGEESGLVQGCGAGDIAPEQARGRVQQLAGRIASVRVQARKPAADGA